jgi:hypothetical protein
MAVRCAVAVLLLGSVAAGCTTVTTTHRPIYRAEPHTSEIRATAENPQFGISSIVINVTSGAMTDCSEFSVVPGMNTRSIIPCRGGAVQTANTCVFAGAPANATCNVSLPIERSTLVSYTVTATSGAGQTSTTDEVAYAGGTQILQRVARPVYWHRQASRGSRIDLAFFPDTDYQMSGFQ